MALALTGLIFLTVRRSVWALPLAGALLAWLPASSLVVMSPVLMAERLVYLPVVFLCVLAGGLRPENAAASDRIGVWALDVNSGVEESAGRKSGAKLIAFCERLRGEGRA